MPNTYTQLYVQMVFAVKGREALVLPHFRVELQQYITGIVSKRNHKPLAIHCNPDHSHLFVGLNPNQSIADLMRDVKSNASSFINARNLLNGNFEWQNGYGAFSYDRSSINNVVRYILNQEEHHKKASFKEEYLSLLNDFGITYDEKFLFEFYD